MAKEKLIFTIRTDGSIEERVEGVPGPRCEQVTMPIEEELGEVVERTYTAEYVLRKMPEPTKVGEAAKANSRQAQA
jgi:hypothetical protein